MNLISADGTFKLVTSAVKRILGFDPDELKGKSAFDYIHPDDRNYVINEFAGLVEMPSGSNKTIDFRYRRKDGTFRYIQASGVNLIDDEYINGIIINSRDVTEYKDLLNELSISEEFYRETLSSISDSVFVTDENGKINFACANVSFIFGYIDEEFLDKNVKSILGSHIITEELLSSDIEVKNLESKVTDKTGEEHLLLVNVKKVDLIKGSLLVTCRDVTERKKAEDAYIESEQKFRQIYEHLPVGIAQVSLDFKIQSANQAYCKMLGYTEEELIGTHISDITHTEILEENLEKQKELGMGKIDFYTMEKSFIHKNGKTVYGILCANLIRKTDGTPNYFLGTVLDITETKKKDREIQEYKDLLLTAMNNSPAGIAIAEAPTGKLRYVNQAGLDIRGKLKNDGKIITDVEIQKYVESWQIYHLDGITPYEPERVPLARAILNGEHVVEDFIIIRDVGEKRIVSAKASPIFDYNGNVKAGVVVFMDITEKEKIIDELKEAKEKAEEANILKNEFLANMSHEIRTPLSGILGFNEIMLMDDSLTREQKENLEYMHSSGKRLLKLLTDILLVSKIEAGKTSINKTKFKLTEMFNDLKSLFYINLINKPIEFKIQTNNVDEIYSDPLRINQILTNLIGNAIKFTKEGQIIVKVEKKEEYYLFSVSDTGIGIPENIQNVIFDNFTSGELGNTKEYQGSGLGLAISKKLVNLLEGKIWFESEKNKGSTFYFSVPAADENNINVKANVETVIDKSDIKERSLKIIAADDEPITLMYLEKLINKKTNFKLTNFTNAKAFLGEIKNNPDYDLVLLDIQMPEMDGIECIRKLKEINKDIPVIAFTAYAMENDKNRFLDLGFDGYISKPVDIDELLLLIDKMVK